LAAHPGGAWSPPAASSAAKAPSVVCEPEHASPAADHGTGSHARHGRDRNDGVSRRHSGDCDGGADETSLAEKADAPSGEAVVPAPSAGTGGAAAHEPTSASRFSDSAVGGTAEWAVPTRSATAIAASAKGTSAASTPAPSPQSGTAGDATAADAHEIESLCTDEPCADADEPATHRNGIPTAAARPDTPAPRPREFRSVLDGLPGFGGEETPPAAAKKEVVRLGDVVARLFGVTDPDHLPQRLGYWLAGSFALGLLFGVAVALAF
jgi:hypothetical protein